MIRQAFRLRMGVLATVAAGVTLAASLPADAAVVSFTPSTSFASSPLTIAFGNGSVSFSAIPKPFFGAPTAQVSTSGTDLVSSFLTGVGDFGAGSSIDQTGELYSFSAFAKPAAIPNSSADDFIGLAFTSPTGLQYGYAEVFGTTLVSYGYQTSSNTSILTGAAAAVPEPATAAVLLSGLAGVALLRTRRKS